MARIGIVPAAAVIVAACAGASPVPRSAPPAVAKQAIREAMPMGSVPAIGVLEIRHGKVAAIEVAGVRQIGTRTTVRPNDQWHLGSNAKPMTAVLVQTLVDRGKLKWDDRLVDRLPELAEAGRAYREVTLMDLATHTSGLPENTDADFLLSFYKDRRPLPAQRLAYLKRALADPPERSKGEYGYSNTGFIALGAVAERAAGQSYEHLMQRLVFDRLGMHSAGFGATGRGQPLYHEKGKAIAGPMGDNPLMFAPAGGIHMSLADWAKWSIDELNGPSGRGKLMRVASYRFLQQPRIERAGKDTKVAMDWGVKQHPFGRMLGHSGSNGGWYALIGLAPDIGNGVLVVANGAEDMKGDLVTTRALKTVIESWPAKPN